MAWLWEEELTFSTEEAPRGRELEVCPEPGRVEWWLANDQFRRRFVQELTCCAEEDCAEC